MTCVAFFWLKETGLSLHCFPVAVESLVRMEAEILRWNLVSLYALWMLEDMDERALGYTSINSVSIRKEAIYSYGNRLIREKATGI